MSLTNNTPGVSAKKLLTLTLTGALFLALASPVWAEKNKSSYKGQGGGYTGAASELVTVEQAKTQADDSWVGIKGQITKRLGDDKYTFTDASGSVTVEIDNDKWAGQNVAPNDTVIIYGEVDDDLMSFEIDVKQVFKQ